MPTQPINQNNNHGASDRLESRNDPDSAPQKTTGKYSGRTVVSDDRVGSPELSHTKADIDRSELMSNRELLSTVNDSFGCNDVKRPDSGFESDISDNDLNDSLEFLPSSGRNSSESDSFCDSDLGESDSTEGDEGNSESGGESDHPAMTSGISRKNALRFAVVLNLNEIEVLKCRVMREDVDYFVKCFDGLKGDFFHTGDYLVEHVAELTLKIQKRFVRFSDVSIHAGQLVFWWNLLCKEAQSHLIWGERVELELLEPSFIKGIEKRKKLEKRRFELYAEHLDKDNNKTGGKAVKAQKALEHFKADFYLPEVEKLKQRLCEVSAEEKSRRILGKCYYHLSDVLQGNVRNIVGEVDKWTRNLLLNRTFIESGLTTNDIIC